VLEPRADLRGMAAYRPPIVGPYTPSNANFVLVRVAERHREFVQHMDARGILVRDRSTDPGCDGHVRIMVGTQSQTAQLLAALGEWTARTSAGVPA